MTSTTVPTDDGAATTTMNAERPIPVVEQRPIEAITIVECGDDLVDVEGVEGLHVAPAYHEQGIANAPSSIRLRRRVVEALRRASASLPDGIDLLVWDGLRTLETQAEIVDAFAATLPEEGRQETIEQYLAPPPESEDSFRRFPPPHSTGGAVDLTLCDVDGRPLDLGAGFDEFTERSWLSYYESDDHPADQRDAVLEYRRRRRLLFWAMLDAGFSPYPWEYWHYELGTQVAAAYHGHPVADYGAAVPWAAAD